MIYRNHRSVLEERILVIAEKPLVRQPFDVSKLEETIKGFDKGIY